jgi:hypothetical protein
MTVSIAKLANNTPSPLIIGGLSFSAGSDLVYWDAYDPFSTENTFNDLRVAEAEMYAAIDAGTVSMKTVLLWRPLPLEPLSIKWLSCTTKGTTWRVCWPRVSP